MTNSPPGPPRAAILGAIGSPPSRAHGAYARASNQDMLIAALDG